MKTEHPDSNRIHRGFKWPAWTPRAAAAVGALLALTLSLGVAAQKTDSAPTRESELVELIVLYSEDQAKQGVKSDDLIAAVKTPERNDAQRALNERLDSPIDARHVISERHTFDKDLLARDPQHPDEDPPAIVLQRYVVLTYPSEDAMRAALRKLRADPAVLWAGANVRVHLSANVSDPFTPNTGNAFTYQWGLHAINAFSAWDNVRGHAYVGHIDTGVQTGATQLSQPGTVNPNNNYPSIHPDLKFNFKPQFAYYAPPTPGPFDDYIGTYRGHGTHVAGIIAANTAYPNAQYGHPQLASQGGAGVCWYCPLMVAKIFTSDGGMAPTMAPFADAIYWAMWSGAQVINLSLGITGIGIYGGDYTAPNYCANNVNDLMCQALSFAAQSDVVISAAAGNHGYTTKLQFPASDSRTIAVGASQINGNRWVENLNAVAPNFLGSNYSPGMATRGVLAPGRDILSTFYQGYEYGPTIRCADSVGGVVGDGYGPCTGTSMAAAYVTGVVGLMRSINPLLSATDIRSRLLSTAANALTPTAEKGYGLINAAAATTNVLSTTNRLTPLFSFYSSQAYNYFYTTVPHMGKAAVTGTLLPKYSLNGFSAPYTPVGNAVNIYPLFPGTNSTPLAQAWIFTTHKNPQNPNVELRPLYRLSYKCGDPLGYVNPVCSLNPKHVDHFYSTDINEANTYVSSAGYKLDGIEGYVYPYGQPQPPGTELLVRAYHTGRDDHAIFPLSQNASMSAQGYNQYVTYLGYVYPNSTGNRPVY